MRKLFILLFVVAFALSGCGLFGGGDPDAGKDSNVISRDDPKQVPDFADTSEAIKKGDEYLDLGLYRMAIAAYKQATKLDPGLPEGHFKLGVAFSLYVKENPARASETSEKNAETAFKNAITTYKRIIRADPENADAHFNLGRSYAKLFRDSEAARAMQKAVRLDDDNGLYRTELGSVLIKLARYSSAIRQLRKALEIDENNIRAEELLEKARAGRRRVVFKGGDRSNSNSNSNSGNTPERGDKSATPTRPLTPGTPPPLPPPANNN